MSEYDKWTQGSATIFGWLDCKDIAAELPAPSNLGESLSYTQYDAWTKGMIDKEMESYVLPWGYELVLYDADGFGGESKVLRGKQQDTYDNELQNCVNLDDDWRNRARSYKMRKF